MDHNHNNNNFKIDIIYSLGIEHGLTEWNDYIIQFY